MLDTTGSEEVPPGSSTFLIGTPLAVVTLIVLFFVLRWVLSRLVDRLVKRAETGTLSAKVGRLSLGAGRAKAPSPTELATATRRVQRAKAMGVAAQERDHRRPARRRSAP